MVSRDRKNCRRHIVTLGDVAPAICDHVVDSWGAVKVNGALTRDDKLLVLYSPDMTSPSDFLGIVAQAGGLGVAFGAVPIYPDDGDSFRRFLSDDDVVLSLADCRFRLDGASITNDDRAPSILTRTLAPGPADIANDIATARLLFMQGHSGPADGSFGRNLTLCSRPVHRAAMPVFFPCAQSDACFRQNPMQAEIALVDAQSLMSPIVILDGCGTFPVPGSIYRYEQSILRSLVRGGQVRAAILSIGISATPPATIVLLMALLAAGVTLGEAVLRCNRLRSQAGSPSSLAGGDAAPWVLVGNPDLKATGLEIGEARILANGLGRFVVEIDDASPSATGRLAMAAGVDVRCPLEIVKDTAQWTLGACEADGTVYFWTNGMGADRPAPIRIGLAPADPDASARWREHLAWLRAGTAWLDGLGRVIEGRGGDAAPVRSLIALRSDFAQSVEMAVYAAAPRSTAEILPALAKVAPSLTEASLQIDKATARIVAAAIPAAGARLSHLWNPSWHHAGTADLATVCNCGSTMAGHTRRHPLLAIERIEISCPACSLVGDVSALPRAAGNPAVGVAEAQIDQRVATPGSDFGWMVRRGDSLDAPAFACGTLFDPFRVHKMTSDTIAVGGDPALVCLPIGADWPQGLSWTTLVLTTRGQISLFAFDVVVERLV
jgi:hypothetical protein